LPNGTGVHVAYHPYTSRPILSLSSFPTRRSSDLSGGSVDITVGRGVEKTVTFTNETNLGSVTVCKNAGTGIPVGQQFTFTVTVGTGRPLVFPPLTSATRMAFTNKANTIEPTAPDQ